MWVGGNEGGGRGGLVVFGSGGVATWVLELVKRPIAIWNGYGFSHKVNLLVQYLVIHL